MTAGHLEALGITHRFEPEVAVLGGVDLRVERGEAVALLGANGAGKTTLLRILGGVLEPDAGEVKVDGQSLAEVTRREIARAISIVPQSRAPAFGFTALEFVLMGFHAKSRRLSLDGVSQRRAAHDALVAMEVGELADRAMSQLSGGEAQRVTMARTLASGATYWLLDEPTSNLDLRHQLALLETVRSHCDGGGAALAIVHDPNLVPRWFDRVLVLSGGKIVADGAPQDELTPELFAAAFGQRMRWVGEPDAGAWIPELDPPQRDDVERTATSRSTQ